jgi:hypothetical protein
MRAVGMLGGKAAHDAFRPLVKESGDYSFSFIMARCA